MDDSKSDSTYISNSDALKLHDGHSRMSESVEYLTSDKRPQKYEPCTTSNPNAFTKGIGLGMHPNRPRTNSWAAGNDLGNVRAFPTSGR